MTRMRTLVQETQDTFARKYPNRRPTDWQNKIQKYRQPAGSKTLSVPLGDVVRGIQAVYFEHEP